MVSLFGRRMGVKPPSARRLSRIPAGSWQLAVSSPGQVPTDITVFRGVPTQPGAMAFEDPFGPSNFTFTLPAVSVFDAIGKGDLSWLAKEANIDVLHIGSMPVGYPFAGFAWEGFIGNFDWGDNGLQVQCVGAMHQVDLELAKPLYPARPSPYEVAIARAFDISVRPYLRTKGLRIEWPDWWKTLYAAPDASTPSYMIPIGVKAGDPWTGLLTRSTGSWDALLTSYVQTMLVSMYTERGRWTIDLDPGRQPVLRHRDRHFEAGDDDVIIDVAQPGMKAQFSEDWTQSLNVAYGSGQSLAGVGYSGMEVSGDGQTTFYRPLAAMRQVEPVTDKNGWYIRDRFRREVKLDLQAGLSENDARRVGAAHVQLFGDPGITGTLTMNSDPTLGGVSIPRHLVRAGMTVRTPKVFGVPDGPVFHVVSSTHDFASETTTLTVDSKYRDYLTVQEVLLRGRDALSVTRQLVSGGYQPPVQDQLLPWNYAAGSGMIPSGAQFSALRLFQDMPADVQFPWTEWTTQRPPKSAAWRSSYIHLGPASTNADNNWTGLSDSYGSRIGIPVKMAQAGTIRLLQFAAYDRDGNVLPVDFHVSFYYSRGVNYTSMPSMPTEYESRYPPYMGGQRYPFFPNAWESYNDDGTQRNPDQASAVQTSGLIRAYGSAYEKAGHWPGSSAAGDPATGLLVDEAQWSFDTTHFDANFDPYSATKNLSNPLAGQIYAMVWCDGQQQQDVYFAGRMFRVEPGMGT